MPTEQSVVRLAAIGDLHCGKASQGTLQLMFSRVAQQCDILLLLGDLTNYGLPEEAQILVKELSGALRLPVLAVLGNHDVESGKDQEVVKILTDAGIRVLEGDSIEVNGIGFAGTKGFGGGFGRRALAPWGERIIKDFVNEAVQESLRLEMSLARLRTPTRVVLLHYSPIQATCNGEPLEIAPFLGSSRLEEPIDRYRSTVVFHGHAHHGSPEGKTKSNVPVFNVAMPLLRQLSPELPFKIFEVPAIHEAAGEPAVHPALG